MTSDTNKSGSSSTRSKDSGTRAKTTASKLRSNLKKDILALDYTDRGREHPKVCFLSGRERRLLSGGHSRLDCSHRRDCTDIGPGTYQTEALTSGVAQLLNKVTSTAGYGGLASRAPRFSEKQRIESVPTHLVPGLFHKQCFLHLTKVRVGKAPVPSPPFGSAVPRKSMVREQDTPGFYYDVTKKPCSWKLPFDHSFGGRTKLRPHVFIKCTPENLDVCSRCDAKPAGDYWFYNTQYLCRPCYDAEWSKPTKYTRRQLKAFSKIRDCSHIHEHEGTTAAYPIMSMKDLWRQQVLECYFACYQGPRQIINTEPRGQAWQSRCQDRNIGRRKPKSTIQVLFKNPKN